MMRVILVDDEPLALEELERLVTSCGASVVDRAANGNDALRRLKDAKADLVFLDIEMPGMNGLEVASQLALWEKPPFVVFATAFNQYAIEAFEANAIDYILKPYETRRVQKALDRAAGLLQAKQSSKENLQSLESDLISKGMLKKLVGHRKNARDRIVIDPQDVYFFNVQYSEVIARLEKQELIVNSTLRELLEFLDPARFAQTHKSWVVNLDKIEKVSPMFSGNFEISLKPPVTEKVPLSRRYAKSIKTRLRQW